MRWQVILAITVSLCAIGLEHRPVLGQLFPGIARACGGCGRCRGCRPPLFPRRACRVCPPNNCACPPIPCAPAPCAPPVMCPTYETRMHPRRVVNWEMVPKTVCRREAYCEQVPVTTYRQVVITVPQTEYRTVLRHQMVAQQVMVPRRNVCTVWEPRMHRTFRPVCPPTPMIMPQPPVHTDGCTDFGLSGPSLPTQSYDNMNSSPAPLTVPSAPSLSTPSTPSVPRPQPDPGFRPTDTNGSQTHYSPWQTVPSRQYGPSHGYFEHSHDHHSHNHHTHGYYGNTAGYDGFRTLSTAPRLADTQNPFVPAPPSSATIWSGLR